MTDLSFAWAPEVDPDFRGPIPDAIPVDPFTLEPPVGADGSWVPLPVIRFPEADTYQGTATKAVMTFSIPLPDQLGVLERWWADRFRNGIIEEAQRQGVTPLVVAAWRDTTPTFSTKYSLTLIAAGASPVPIPVLIALITVALFGLGILLTIKMESVDHFFMGTKGTPAQLVPEGSAAPPGTVDAFGHPVTPGTPAPPGSYIPPTAGKPGLLDKLEGLGGLALIFLLVSMFRRKGG